MFDDPFKTAMLAVLATALLVAAFTDLRSRRIANWLTAGVALLAPVFWLATGTDLWPGVALQLGVALATFAVGTGLFALKWMGGGDVKLLAALALWIEPLAFLQLLVIMALLGGVLTLAFGMWHIARRQRDRLSIPYGLAISAAGLWTIGVHYVSVAAPAVG